jgi:hypothetical protein
VRGRQCREALAHALERRGLCLQQRLSQEPRVPWTQERRTRARIPSTKVGPVDLRMIFLDDTTRTATISRHAESPDIPERCRCVVAAHRPRRQADSRHTSRPSSGGTASAGSTSLVTKSARLLRVTESGDGHAAVEPQANVLKDPALLTIGDVLRRRLRRRDRGPLVRH